VLPNVILAVFVRAGTIAFPRRSLIEAIAQLPRSLGPAGDASGGNMLNEGRTYLETRRGSPSVPGIATWSVLLAFNLIGDGLRDILDPNVQ